MSRVLALIYGSVAYVIFLGTFLYAIGFVGNVAVPKSIDSGTAGPVGQAILINVLLMSLFAIQHSVMARPWFKRRWTRIVPKPIERSTFVLLASAVLILLFWQWRPITNTIWNVEGTLAGTVLTTLFWLGWALVLIATFLINHFDLFGLRQVWLRFQKREYEPIRFRIPGIYRYVRHPLYLGFIIAFWSTPHMTGGHLLFAAVTTAYMLVAIQFEERDLVEFLGDDYAQYRRAVSMIIPRPPKKASRQEAPGTPGQG